MITLGLTGVAPVRHEVVRPVTDDAGRVLHELEAAVAEARQVLQRLHAELEQAHAMVAACQLWLLDRTEDTVH